MKYDTIKLKLLTSNILLIILDRPLSLNSLIVNDRAENFN